MNLIEKLKAKIQKLTARRDEIMQSIVTENDPEKRAALGETLKALKDDIEEAEGMLADAEADEGNDGGDGAGAEGRGFNPVAAFGAGNHGGVQTRNADPLASMEYRKAFMEYVQRGSANAILKRADAEHVSTDLGILLPSTIVNEIIKGVEKVYGQLYARVKKTNVKGGVQYPIGAFTATMYWDGTSGTDKEHGVSENQKTGGVTDYVQFTYHIGEIRIAQSLLQTVVTVDAFEREIVNALVEAYVKAMDEAILNGDGVKQPEGILIEAAKGASRIPASNIISFSAEEMEDWKTWQKKLFAKIPLSMRALRPEFVMTPETWEGNIMTLEDTNGRPVYRETYNPETGDEKCTFKGRSVTLVEEGGIKSFDTASDGDVFAMMWVPDKAYLINSNLQFSYKKYIDEKTNQYVTKALVICDGKVLDGKYIYLLKKAASTTT